MKCARLVLIAFFGLAPVVAFAATESEVKEKEAETEADPGEGKLLGDWAGIRTKFAKDGFTFGLFYTGEVVRNFGGGVESATTYMAKATLAVDLDCGVALALPGWKLHSSAVQMYGTGPSRYTGDFQMTSNIEANQTSRIYDAWIQKEFANQHLSVLAGLYDWNSENNITDSALVFLNSSFGMGAELSQAPVNGGVMVSTYPTAAMGLRVLLENKGAYVNAAVLDGFAGNPNTTDGTTFRLASDDGAFVGAEAGYKVGSEDNPGLPAKYAVGTWAFTKPVDDIPTGDKNTNYGFYFLAEQALSSHVSLFARYGTASALVNQIQSNFAAGITFNKVISAFDNDQIGIGFTQAWNGDEYIAAQEAAGTPVEGSESAWEILYRFEPFPGLAVQPDFQYVFNPGMDPSLKDTANFFIRFDLSL